MEKLIYLGYVRLEMGTCGSTSLEERVGFFGVCAIFSLAGYLRCRGGHIADSQKGVELLYFDVITHAAMLSLT